MEDGDPRISVRDNTTPGTLKVGNRDRIIDIRDTKIVGSINQNQINYHFHFSDWKPVTVLFLDLALLSQLQSGWLHLPSITTATVSLLRMSLDTTQ
jgi:hypothetical protein